MSHSEGRAGMRKRKTFVPHGGGPFDFVISAAGSYSPARWNILVISRRGEVLSFLQ